MKKIENLRIYGRRWFQKSYGNTYHTVRVIVNGEELASSIVYGYGEHYKETARQLLEENGYEVPGRWSLTGFLRKMTFWQPL